MMDLKAIAEKFDFSVKDLLEYRLHWMPRYVVFRSKVEKLTLAAGGETFDEWVRYGKDYIPASKAREAAKQSGFIVCRARKEIARGRKHAASVRQLYIDEGMPDEWEKLVRLVEREWQCFRVVRPLEKAVLAKAKETRR